MGHAAVISVGDEILSGRIHDTNATWLCAELRLVGFPVVLRETVPDDPEAIGLAIGRCAKAADVVLVSGGLGPTPDDLTREGLARVLGTRCVRHARAEALVREIFERTGREVSAANLLQADLPEGSEPLPNTCGTAPGVVARVGPSTVYLVPGVPGELRAMVAQSILPALRVHPAHGAAPLRRTLLLSGLPESELGVRVADLMARGRNPSCGSYPGTAHIRLVFEATDTAQEAAAALLDADVAEVRRRLAHHVVTEGDEDLPGVVASLLLASGRTLAVAESLTGGRVSDLLVATPGISRCFLAGFATYANQAKIDVLGVSPATLQTHGAVSEECAREMAEGARRIAGSDLALSTTGIAGPTGATPDKPVGTVFIALATGAGTTVRHLRIPGDRPQVRERAAAAALDLLRRHLTG